MQSNNRNEGVNRRHHIYKKGDPVIFKDTKYYKDIFYNNLKGKILDASFDGKKYTFVVKVYDTLSGVVNFSNKVRNVTYNADNTTTLTFDVLLSSEDDLENDFESRKVIPFNVCYAISIHKAQGLEFKNVNVVISGEVKEVISHSVFYTAITRAVENLNIYWSPETEVNVIKNLESKNYKTDKKILSNKYPYLRQLIIDYYKK
jgi:ATP-dependent exoDNAse (exonuclease V) alpha subunit